MSRSSFFLWLAVALAGWSPLGAQPRAVRQLRVVEVVSVERLGSSGFDAVLHLTNDSFENRTLASAALELRYKGRPVLEASLFRPVPVAPEFDGPVRIRMRSRIRDSAALHAVRSRLARGKRGRISLSVRLEIETPSGTEKTAVKRMPIRIFLNIFDLRTDDLLKYL